MGGDGVGGDGYSLDMYTVVELFTPSSGSLLVKPHVYTPPLLTPTPVMVRVLVTTPPLMLPPTVTPPAVFGMVQVALRGGDGEEALATQTRERFEFTVTLTEVLRD